MQKEDYLSATALSKRTSATLDALEKGDTEKLIILKNNSPKAILLSMAAYTALEEEIEDLRLASLGHIRLKSFHKEEAITHQTMMEKFKA